MDHMDHIEITTTRGLRYSISTVAVDRADGTIGYTAAISRIAEDGTVDDVVTDANNVDDRYIFDSPRECLLATVAEVI